MEKLYKYHVKCGRSGSLSSVFIATEEEVQSIIGEYVYFGEVLGKHSEIYGTIEEHEITEIDVLPSTIEDLKRVFGKTINGHNPFNYVRYTCDECGYQDETGYFKRKGLCYECAEKIEKNN